MVASGICMAGQQTTRLMKKDVKMAYGLMILFFSLLLLVILYYGAQYLHFAKLFVKCPDGASLDTCMGLASVFRLSFVLAIFHLLVLLSCLTRDGFAKLINEKLWGFKMVLIGGGFIGSLFISNEFFIPYAKASLYFGCIFLFAQAVSLIDAFYLWADFWAEKFNGGNKCYGCLLIFTTIVMYGVSGWFFLIGYKNFWLPGCTGNKFLLITATLLALSFIVLILLKFHPNGSVITSGAITMFGVFLFWAALISNPDTTCNPQYDNKINMFVQIGGSFFFAFSCTIYWALVSKRSVAFQSANLPAVAASEGDEELDKKIEKEQ